MTWAANRFTSRATALALLVTAIGAAWLAVIMPILDKHRANERRISVESERLSQLREAVTRYESAAALGDAIDFTAPQLIDKPTAALQAAALQEIVAALLIKKNIKPRATRVMPPSSHAGMDRVGIQIEVTTELDNLMQAIESVILVQPGLAVQHLRLSPQSPRDPYRRDLVAARLQIYGFVASTGGKSGG